MEEEQMEEEQRGGFVFFGGGLSALISIGVLILALNNPTDSDFQAEAASVIQQEVANTNPLLALMSEEIGRAGADALTIRSTNYVVFTRFEVTTPDARLFGVPSQQFCFLGVMNNFYPCESVTKEAKQFTSSTGASTDEELLQGSVTDRFITATPQGDGIDLERPQGWLCDGVRVRFEASGDELYRITIAGQTSNWVSGFTNCSASCGPNNPVPQYFQPVEGSPFGEASFVLQNDLRFNDRVCEPVK